jgi:hypothetical protein
MLSNGLVVLALRFESKASLIVPFSGQWSNSEQTLEQTHVTPGPTRNGGHVLGENQFRNSSAAQSDHGSIVLPFYLNRQEQPSPRPRHHCTLVTLDP